MNRTRPWVSILCISGLLSAQGAWSAENVCDGKRVRDPKGLDSGQASHIESYCVAAEQADKAQDSQNIVGGVSAAVAAVCGVACVASFFTAGTAETLCTVSSLAGTGINVGVAMAYQQQAQALQSLTALGTSIAINGQALSGLLGGGTEVAAAGAAAAGAKAGAEAGKEAGKEAGANAAACLTMALTGVQSAVSFSGASSSKGTRDSALANAAREYALSQGQHSAAGSGMGTGTSVGTGGSASLASNAGNSPSSSGDGSSSSISFEDQINLALATPGNNLPEGVRSPEFRKALEKVTGMKAEEVLKLGDTHKILAAGMDKVLGAQGREKFDSATRSMVASVGSEIQSGTYASSGGAHSGGRDIGMPDFNSLLDRFMPKGKDPAAGRTGLIQLGARTPASTTAGALATQDASLFERIHKAYESKHRAGLVGRF